MNDESLYARYHRQMILPGFGVEGQRRLQEARVLVAGAGGLGCPVLMSIAGAGVGTVGIVDSGLVELSNLHRQFLYTTADIDQPKVSCAKNVLQKINPGISIHIYQISLANSNAIDIITKYDIIVDATDNFESRYMLADACALLNKPLVFGAVSRFEGQVALFANGINYRDLFPTPPVPGEVLNCSEAGVVGFLPGIIGHLMAGECIKYIIGQGETLTGKLLTYAALKNRFWEMEIQSTPESSDGLPKSRQDFESRDYASLCNATPASPLEISLDEFRSLLSNEEPVVYDVRELHELPALTGITHQRIPMSILTDQFPPQKNATVIFVCQTGKRSLIAAEMYQTAYPGCKVYSLRGGVAALIQTA